VHRGLEALTHEAVAAARDRDAARLERLLAPGFTLTTGRPGAEVRGRAEWLAITMGRYAVAEAAAAIEEVVPLGDAGALVRYRLVQRATFDGADRSGAFRVSDAWAREDGAWRIAARHSTAVPAAGGERLRVRPERLVLERRTGPPAPLRAEVERDDERSLVRPDPDGDWAALEVLGPLDLSLTGITARLAGVLGAAGVPLLPLGTHDTDVLLVRVAHLDRAVEALRASGHDVDRKEPPSGAL
jgi:hypothetical protein